VTLFTVIAVTARTGQVRFVPETAATATKAAEQTLADRPGARILAVLAGPATNLYRPRSTSPKIASAIRDYRAAFLSEMGREGEDRRASTWAKGASAFRALEAWAPPSATLAGLSDLSGWRAALSRSRLRNTTRNHHLAVVSGFCRWAVERGIMERMPLGLRRFPVTTEAPSVLTLSEMRGLVTSLAGDPLRGLVAMVAFAGLRRGEVVRLRLQDIGTTDIVVGADFATKGGRPRTVPMVFQDLPRFLGALPADGPAFVQPSGDRWSDCALTRALNRARKAAGRDFSLKQLRASWVTTLTKEMGIPTALVQQWAGHRSIATTQQYYQGEVYGAPRHSNIVETP